MSAIGCPISNRSGGSQRRQSRLVQQQTHGVIATKSVNDNGKENAVAWMNLRLGFLDALNYISAPRADT